MKVIKKKEDLLLFMQNVDKMLSIDTVNKTKFAHSLKKQVKVMVSAMGNYNDDIEDARIDYCSTDERGNILRNGKDYVFTKEGQKQLHKRTREILAVEVEVEVFLKKEQIEEECHEGFKQFFLEFIEEEKEPCETAAKLQSIK